MGGERSQNSSDQTMFEMYFFPNRTLNYVIILLRGLLMAQVSDGSVPSLNIS